MITTSEGLDEIMRCIDKNIGRVSLYTIKQLLASKGVYDYTDGTSTINYKNRDTIEYKKYIIGMSIVDFLYVEGGCNLPIQTTYSLNKNVYIEIANKVLKRLEDNSIIKIRENYIIIIKDSFNIAKELERKHGIPWKDAYDIIEGIKRKRNY
jgi:hypothetical protein